MSESMNISPPKLPLKFLKWFCNPDMVEDVEGDISELFSKRLKQNKLKARLFFTLDVLLLFRPGMIRKFEPINKIINYAMVRNYIKIAQRNAVRYKGFTLLNLLGLVIGIAASTLILLWINDEVRMDKFHTKGDKIYQLFRNMRQSGGIVNTTFTVPKPAADMLRNEYPEVTQTTQVSWPVTFRFSLEENGSDEVGRYVTPEFLDMFSFPLIAGDKASVLADLSSIVVSETVARKFFGKDWREETIGKTLRLDGTRDAKITGIFEDIGDNSSLRFDFLLPAQEFYSRNDWVDDWGNGSFGVYFTVDNEIAAKTVAERVLNEIKVHAAGQDNAGDEELVIHKYQDYYLYSNWDNGVINGGRIDYVNIMSVVAVFILIVACINFMNLATARSGRRSKEIGLRKVMGAHKKSISIQFYVEAFLLTSIAVVLAIGIVIVLLPYFNILVEKSLFLDFTLLQTWVYFFGIIIVVTVLSGSYPALLLPTFNIIQSLKGTVKQSSGAAYFRKGLVVFQFAISTLLIIGTSVVYKQINYILTKDLGLDKENLVAVSMEGDLGRRLDTYKTELMNIPEVKAVTGSSGNPLNYGRSTSSANWEGKSPDAGYEINIMLTDYDFIQTMGMDMKLGRDFSNELADSTNFIINEAAAELMGFDDPLQKDLSFWGIDGNIIGVVKDFHMADMYEPIAPLIITCISPGSSSVAFVRIQGSPNSALKSIEKVTKEFNPAFDFDYQFVDESFAETYRAERTLSTLAGIFAVISILISCLGLFGLSAFTAERRSLEIGVRKVHGASVPQILVLLSKDYSKLMLIAFILAIPFGYYFTQKWLDDFEFRTALDPFVFLIAGILTFLIGVLTVSAKSYQAATVNPTDSLKDE